MGTKQSGCFTAWYPTSTPPAGGWPVYHFICGTTSPPSDYAATLKHVASHGIFAVANYMDLDLTPGLPKGTYPISTKCAKSLTTGATPVKVDARNIVSGGHSGGGPLAVRINDDFQGNYVGYVGQHAAAIVGSNKPTKAQLAKVRGKVLQMCGTKDTMPTCGCSDAKNSYYDRYPAATPRALLKSPGTHITGVCKDSGDRNEGGSVVAFLSYVLNGDACGREALHEKRSGYSFQDDLGSSPAPPPSPPPPTPPAPPPVPPPTPSTYACIAQQCVAADSGVDLPICQAAC